MTYLVGGGSVSFNVDYQKIIYNDIDVNIYNLVKMFKDYTSKEIINRIEENIKKYGLLITGVEKKSTDKSIIENQKSYYYKFRDDYNKTKNKDVRDLFTLILYSYCHLLRLNSKGECNTPKGHNSYTKDDKQHIIKLCDKLSKTNIEFMNNNAFDILKSIKYNDNQFIYLDPPYTNTGAKYNDKWNIQLDYKLFKELDRLNELSIKWALSNVNQSKSKENNHLIEWAKKYHIMDLNKNYASYGKGNARAQEVLILNYEPRVEQLKLF